MHSLVGDLQFHIIAPLLLVHGISLDSGTAADRRMSDLFREPVSLASVPVSKVVVGRNATNIWP